jgi:hypothetical protein
MSTNKIARLTRELRAMTKSYEQRLRDGVSKDDAVGHRNFLKTYAAPMDKLLERLIRSGDFTTIFDSQEQKQVAKFKRLLEQKSVPLSLVKVEEDDPILLL